MPLMINSNSPECPRSYRRAPSAIVAKNSLASDFMIRAIRGFADGDAAERVATGSGELPPHPARTNSVVRQVNLTIDLRRESEGRGSTPFMTFCPRPSSAVGSRAEPMPRARGVFAPDARPDSGVFLVVIRQSG